MRDVLYSVRVGAVAARFAEPHARARGRGDPALESRTASDTIAPNENVLSVLSGGVEFAYAFVVRYQQ